jgi:hypothetical protein
MLFCPAVRQSLMPILFRRRNAAPFFKLRLARCPGGSMPGRGIAPGTCLLFIDGGRLEQHRVGHDEYWHLARRGLVQERVRLVVEDDIAAVILIANTLFVRHDEAALDEGARVDAVERIQR